jgi:hypothetical protein
MPAGLARPWFSVFPAVASGAAPDRVDGYRYSRPQPVGHRGGGGVTAVFRISVEMLICFRRGPTGERFQIVSADPAKFAAKHSNKHYQPTQTGVVEHKETLRTSRLDRDYPLLVSHLCRARG